MADKVNQYKSSQRWACGKAKNTEIDLSITRKFSKCITYKNHLDFKKNNLIIFLQGGKTFVKPLIFKPKKSYTQNLRKTLRGYFRLNFGI